MSENVTSVGVMVPLITPITDELELEELGEKWYDEGSGVQINYQGTLLYTSETGDEYGIHFGAPGAVDQPDEWPLPVHRGMARPYRCNWYNGTDSDMSMLTLEQFIKETGQ